MRHGVVGHTSSRLPSANSKHNCASTQHASKGAAMRPPCRQRMAGSGRTGGSRCSFAILSGNSNGGIKAPSIASSMGSIRVSNSCRVVASGVRGSAVVAIGVSIAVDDGGTDTDGTGTEGLGSEEALCAVVDVSDVHRGLDGGEPLSAIVECWLISATATTPPVERSPEANPVTKDIFAPYLIARALSWAAATVATAAASPAGMLWVGVRPLPRRLRWRPPVPCRRPVPVTER